jgi:hypothetical protein
MAFRFKQPFPSDYNVEQLSRLPADEDLPIFGDGGGPILRVTRADGSKFILKLPDGDSPKVMSWPHPRKMLVSLLATDWLVDIDHPALEPFPVPRRLKGKQSFAVPEKNLYIAVSSSKVVAYGPNGPVVDIEYDDNVDDVELVGDTLIVTWKPNSMGKCVDHINVVTGAIERRGQNDSGLLAGLMTFRVLMISLVLLWLAFFIFRPHMVTVFEVVAPDGTLVQYASSSVDCNNDVLTHNHTPSEVNVYGRVACRSHVEWQWGW